jgi:hypothetical protein
MFKKGVAPLLAIAAFAVMPVAAQATGHYYQNNVKLVEGAKRTVTEWGTITLAGVKGGTLPNHITCHNAAGGTIENPVGGGAGVGATEVFVAYQCESENQCPAPLVTRATAEKITNGVGWPTVITEPAAETFRTESSKVKVDIGCFNPVELEKREGGTHFVEIGGYGSETAGLMQKPLNHNGTNAAHPSGVIFGEGSGELEAEGSANTVSGKTEGEVKTQGYTAQELITVKP